MLEDSNLSELMPQGAGAPPPAHRREPANIDENRFRAVSDMGFDVVPVAPHQKWPGIFDGETWKPMSGWTSIHPTAVDLDRWHSDGASVGVHHGDDGLVLDIDVTDEVLADRIERDATAMFGQAPCRVGLWPKRALFYRVASPFNKTQIGAKDAVVEFRTGPHQTVAFGPHPSGCFYQWPRPLVTKSDLPVVSLHNLRLFKDRWAEVLGGQKTSISEAGVGGSKDQSKLKAAPELVAAALDAIPNDSDDPRYDRDWWIALGNAVHAAMADDLEAGREMWLGICRRHPSHDEDKAERFWDTAKAPHEIGWDWLSREARQHSEAFAQRIVESQWWANDNEIAEMTAAEATRREKVAIDAANGLAVPEPMFPVRSGDEVKPRTINPTPYAWRDPATIPPRQWLYGGHYIRKFISATVAPGGLGKSSLTSVEGLAMATGRPLLGVQPHGRYKVWIWNGEDPLEEVERRIAAAALFHGVQSEELEGQFFFDSGRQTPITIAKQTKDGTTIHEPDVAAIGEAVRRHGIDVLIIDPFISSHRVTENDNDAINLVVKEFARLADRENISIELVHHARKLHGKEMTAEDSRGGSSLVDGARAVRTLVRASKDDIRHGLVGEPRSYFRFGQGKENLTAPATASTVWMTLRSQALGNGTEDYPQGDSVGVTAKFTPLEISSENLDADTTGQIVEILRSGEYRDDPRSSDWSGNAVAKVLGIDANDKDDKLVINQWLRDLKATRKITTVRRKDENRKARQFVVVCDAEN